MAKTIQLHAFHKSVYARVLSKHFTASKFKVWVASIIGHSHSNKGQKHGTAFLALCSLQKHLHSEFRLCFQKKKSKVTQLMTWINLDQIFLPSFTILSSQDSGALSCTAQSLRFEPTSEAEKDASNSCLVA